MIRKQSPNRPICMGDVWRAGYHGDPVPPKKKRKRKKKGKPRSKPKPKPWRFKSGENKGKTLKQIPCGMLLWMADKTFPKPVLDEAKREFARRCPNCQHPKSK